MNTQMYHLVGRDALYLSIHSLSLVGTLRAALCNGWRRTATALDLDRRVCYELVGPQRCPVWSHEQRLSVQAFQTHL